MQQFTITGGAGFIGANLANFYLDRGHRVVIYDSLARNGCLANLQWLRANPNAENFQLIIGDVRLPPPQLTAAIEASDALFHFAGQVAVTSSVTDPVFDFQVNAQGTFRMLELVRNSKGKTPAFFYSSTNKVYGGMEQLVIVEDEERYRYRDLPDGIREDQLLDFHSPYGCSKGAGDQYVRDYARIYNLKTVVFRQSCIYGCRQFGLEDQGWVAWFIIAAMLDLPITIYGDGKQVRDILFIDDLVNAYDLALRNIDTVAGKVYNIGGGPDNTISLRELIALLRRKVNPDLNLARADWRPGDQPVYVSDITRARRDFAWQPATDWETGVHRLVDWVHDNRVMLESMFPVPAGGAA